MPVSHKHECIFIHLPKTGGTSIASAIFSNKISDDETDIASGRLSKHSTALEIREYLGKKTWNKYFKFAFVRNPFDLMVSNYFWWLQIADSFPELQEDVNAIRQMKDFEEFIKSRRYGEMITRYKGNYFKWLADETGKIIVDYIGHFERYDDDCKTIFSRINLLEKKMPRKKQSVHRHYSIYYNDETKEVVAKRYRNEIELFGYSFTKINCSYDIYYFILKKLFFTFEHIQEVTKFNLCRTKSYLCKQYPSFYVFLRECYKQFTVKRLRK